MEQTMTPKTLANLLENCITPIKILKDLGITDIPKELVLKNQEIIDSRSIDNPNPSIKFCIQRNDNTIKFCWYFPWRHERLTIQTNDKDISVYFQTGRISRAKITKYI
tara:strand:+ start:462 stop:785 length:324 start_codon:yes stop_codon:yes gene_type:complete